jgi:uncharacterized flavoprotein (TIGR03862 family)
MKKTVAIIGSGPSALMLASQLNSVLFDVTIYEQNFATARKFLVAGKGGFNLTHSEPITEFISRYTPSSFFEKLITSFTNDDLRKWFQQLGIPTFIGSSKRVYPQKGIKPIDVLNAILNDLAKKNVRFKMQHQWLGWNNNEELVFNANQQKIAVPADITIFALGGGSWKKTGSDGNWTALFSKKGIKIIPFQPSNCAVQVMWPQSLLDEIEGQSLKNISVKCLEKEKKGEIVITNFGLEGGAVYAMSSGIRQQLAVSGIAKIDVDFKPALTIDEIENKIANGRGNKSWTKHLENELNLNNVQLTLLKNYCTKDEFTNPKSLANKIKNLTIPVSGMANIDEAISTVGGISLAEIDADFQLKKIPNSYLIGEMLDWDAPTGGYLLQACFSMGYHLAQQLNEKHSK